MLRSGTLAILAALTLASCGGDDEEWLDQAAGGGSGPAATAEAGGSGTTASTSKPTSPKGSAPGKGGVPAPGALPGTAASPAPGAPGSKGSGSSKGRTPSASPGTAGSPGTAAQPPAAATPKPGESRLSKDPRGDERRASEAADTFFKASNAREASRVCRELYTKDGVERRTGKTGEDAIKTCEDNIRKYEQPDLVKVEKATSNNFEWCTLIVKLRVLTQTRDARMILRLQDGIWKVDRIASV